MDKQKPKTTEFWVIFSTIFTGLMLTISGAKGLTNANEESILVQICSGVINFLLLLATVMLYGNGITWLLTRGTSEKSPANPKPKSIFDHKPGPQIINEKYVLQALERVRKNVECKNGDPNDQQELISMVAQMEQTGDLAAPWPELVLKYLKKK